MSDPDGRAELVMTGRIATLAGPRGFGWVDSVAIADGRIVAAGRPAEVAPLGGAGTLRWDLGDRWVAIPGITDAHLHLVQAARAASELDLSEAPDRAATLAAIRRRHEERVAAGDAEGWLLGHGWLLDRVLGWPTAADLETVAPGRRVALWSHDHHSRWVSAAALRAAGIGRETADPPGGLVRRDEDRAPTGILHEEATKLVDSAIPSPALDELATAIASYAGRLAALGVVGCHDPGEIGDDRELRRGPSLYAALARDGRLPLRVHASVRAGQLERAVDLGLRTGMRVAPEATDDVRARRIAARYRMGWLKLFADGAMGSRSAALLEPYIAVPGDPAPVGGPTGMLLHPAAVLAEQARSAAVSGIAVQIHAIGDAAVRSALDILAGLPSSRPFRHRIEHAQLVHPRDIVRFAALDVAASVQPVHIVSDAATARAIWGGRCRTAFPVGDLDRAGALVPFGTDAPVESPDPWPGIATAVLRMHPAWGPGAAPFYPEQSIDLARALRAACVDPAETAGDRDGGRLVPGRPADVVVIPAEAVSEPVRLDGALVSCRPLATLIDGEVVHRDPDFDP